MQQVKEIQVSDIEVGEHEKRLVKIDDDVEMLAKSIRSVGILCPLIVRSRNDKYVLVAGHRRLQAAKIAGLDSVPVVCSDLSDAVEAEVCFAENFFRKDLSPVELAGAIKDTLDSEVMTVAELAAGFKKSGHWVNAMIAICKWPEDVQEAVHVGVLSVSAASNLALITDDIYREFLLRNAAEAGATARTTSAWLQAFRAMAPQEQAITAVPAAPGQAQVPMVPQAPCFCCSQMFPVNEMSHVPVCGACIQIIRKAGQL